MISYGKSVHNLLSLVRPQAGFSVSGGDGTQRVDWLLPSNLLPPSPLIVSLLTSVLVLIIVYWHCWDAVVLVFCSHQLDGDNMFLGMPEAGLDFTSTNQVCVYICVLLYSFVCVRLCTRERERVMLSCFSDISLVLIAFSSFLRKRRNDLSKCFCSGCSASCEKFSHYHVDVKQIVTVLTNKQSHSYMFIKSIFHTDDFSRKFLYILFLLIWLSKWGGSVNI